MGLGTSMDVIILIALAVHLAEVYFKDAKITYDCRSAECLEEAKDLISKGYEYVTEMDGTKLFRKPDSV
ncbi:hypothetical protein MCGE09_00430 [Thaumarchaeota archaeon SCGC AB-539-E09]|nr:hypothetical protein MCGE09_00430 [Thaumarchaeota archaeon SCGC AB-539-E09]